jgi:hypothetical protein
LHWRESGDYLAAGGRISEERFNLMSEARPPRLMINIPPDVREWLEDQAERNASHMQAEIIRSVRERMVREKREKAAA